MKNSMDTIKNRMTEAMALAEDMGASAVKIGYGHGESMSVSFENGRLKNTDASETASFGILVIADGRYGRAFANQPDDLMQMMQRTMEMAKVGAPAHFATFPKPSSEYKAIKTFDEKVTTLTRSKLIDDCRELVDAIRGLQDALVIDAGAGVSRRETLVMNNAGLVDEYEDTCWSISGGFTRTSGTDMLFSGASRGWNALDEHYDLEFIKKNVADDLRLASRSATLPDGTYPLLIPPQYVQRFLSPVTMALSGYSVYLGTSPLKDKLDQTPFDPTFTLIDNPHIDFDGDSANMDDSGVPTEQDYLIEKGHIGRFLYDYDTACLCNKRPTGNTGCAPYNPILQTGTLTSGELFKSVKRGIYIKQLLGFGQSNFANGDFSANVSLGFVIENGEIVGRIKNAMIAGNVFEMLKKPIVASSDVDACNHNPYLLFPEVSLFSK